MNDLSTHPLAVVMMREMMENQFKLPDRPEPEQDLGNCNLYKTPETRASQFWLGRLFGRFYQIFRSEA